MSTEKMVYEGVGIPMEGDIFTMGKGYHVSPELYQYLETYSKLNVIKALNYVFGRKPHYQEHHEDGLEECFALTTMIYGRLGNNNAFKFYKRPDGKFMLCAHVLEVLTDAVIVFWNSEQVTNEVKSRLQVQWSATNMLKFMSFPDSDIA